MLLAFFAVNIAQIDDNTILLLTSAYSRHQNANTNVINMFTDSSVTGNIFV